MALGFGFDLMSQAVRQRPWTPRYLFGDGEQGAWYDPSDFATLYQDSAGTTPVTALGQPVGLMLDKSGNGNHAAQATAAARPTVQARANQINNSAFAGAAIGDPGTTPTEWSRSQNNADITFVSESVLTLEMTTSGRDWFSQSPELPANTTSDLFVDVDITNSVPIKEILLTFPPAGSTVSYFWQGGAVSDGTVISGSGTIHIRITTTGTAGSCVLRMGIGCNSSENPNTVTYSNPDLRIASGGITRPTYQRVTTATDYQDIGLPRYLEFDGVDDAMATASVDFSGTDEMTVTAGVYKPTAVAGLVAELSANLNTNNGAFYFFVGPGAGGQDAFGTKGTSPAVVLSGSNTAPRLDVWTARADISQPFAEFRANGSVLSISTSTQGTGNYEDHPLYIGARGGTTSEFNGRIHQLIIRGKTTSGNLLDQLERFVARKTGVTL